MHQMEDERLEEVLRQARLREQEEERRRRKATAEQQVRQAQDGAELAEALPAPEQHFAQLPRPFHTGVR
jgi:hypothetical protein